MNPELRAFLNACRKQRQVTLIGPLQDSVPDWPASPILFVDGGARWRSHLPGSFNYPHLSVGDGDSLGSQKLDVLLETQKDCSDLDYALEILRTIDPRLLSLHGFLGGRRDHEWINFGVTANFLQNGQQQRVNFESAVSLFAPGCYELNHHGVFSLVHFRPATTTIRGDVDYPLTTPTRIDAHTSHGLSNFARGPFSIESDGVTMCFWS